MKKIAISIILLAALAVGAGYFLRTKTGARADVLVPSETVLFLHLPDIQGSRQRWKKTALFQIAQEPEVQAFLARPKSKVPQLGGVQSYSDRLSRINPTEAFVAITSLTATTPKFVAGFSFTGSRDEAAALIADAKAQAQAAWPAAKVDIVKYGNDEIQTITNTNVAFASAFKQGWCFVADDLDLLKSTLDRTGASSDAKSLHASAGYQKSLARMPRNFDALVFAQPQSVIERVIGLVTATGQQLDPAQVEDLRKIEAFSASTKLDGEQIRDSVFVLKPGSPRQPPLARNSLALTSTDTIIYYAALLGQPISFKLPDPALDVTGVLKMLAGLQEELAKHGLQPSDFSTAFGPEIGSVLGWTANAAQPSLLLALDVRDSAKAREFVDFFTGGLLGSPAWMRKELDGVQVFVLKPQGFALVTPTIALTDKSLILGLSPDSVTQALARVKEHGPTLDRNPLFKKAGVSVKTPTSASAYVDTRALFEKVYNTFRPFMLYWSLFVPKAGDYVDLSKLPPTEAIAKHLGPIVYSKSSDENGVLVESAGPVTFGQALVGIGAGAATVAIPMWKSQIVNALPSLQKFQPGTPALPPFPTAVPTPSPTPPPAGP